MNNSSGTFAEKAISFYLNFSAPGNLPHSISVMNPYENDEVKSAVKKFFRKYFDDNKKRIFIWGINPGRLGGGLTGVAFTDPVALKEHCGIETNLKAATELSSRFIYRMINAFGGVEEFYSKCFLTALYPLALIKNNKNYNYYDDEELFNILKDDIVQSMQKQIKFGAERKLALCLGKKNYKYLKIINEELKFFRQIEIVEHPRYIMQYKSKTAEDYIRKYLKYLKR